MSLKVLEKNAVMTVLWTVKLCGTNAVSKKYKKKPLNGSQFFEIASGFLQ